MQLQDILYATDKHKIVDAAVLHSTKAFDRAPHALLMIKLTEIAELDEYLLHWIEDFLATASGVARLCLRLFTCLLRLATRISLGPVLFIVFISDLPDCLDCSCALFADDALVYQEITY